LNESVAQSKTIDSTEVYSADEDSSEEDDPANWEGKPTVAWNEETMTVFNRWSSSSSIGDDEQEPQVELLEESVTKPAIENAMPKGECSQAGYLFH